MTTLISAEDTWALWTILSLSVAISIYPGTKICLGQQDYRLYLSHSLHIGAGKPEHHPYRITGI